MIFVCSVSTSILHEVLSQALKVLCKHVDSDTFLRNVPRRMPQMPAKSGEDEEIWCPSRIHAAVPLAEAAKVCTVEHSIMSNPLC